VFEMTMQILYIDRKDAPKSVQSLDNSRQFRVIVSDSVRLSDNSWSDGTRYTYRGVCLETGEVAHPESDEYGNPFTQPNVPTVQLQPGFVILKYGCFCGRKATPEIYVHPDNAAKLLPEKKELCFLDRVVLCYTRCLKSSYGGVSNYRCKEASRDGVCTVPEWEETKDSLKKRGFLNARGAITTAGRNAIGMTQPHELRQEQRANA
jgi:hypothetical protein